MNKLNPLTCSAPSILLVVIMLFISLFVYSFLSFVNHGVLIYVDLGKILVYLNIEYTIACETNLLNLKLYLAVRRLRGEGTIVGNFC